MAVRSWNRGGNYLVALGRDAAALFSARGDDIFLVKVAYWLGR